MDSKSGWGESVKVNCTLTELHKKGIGRIECIRLKAKDWYLVFGI